MMKRGPIKPVFVSPARALAGTRVPYLECGGLFTLPALSLEGSFEGPPLLQPHAPPTNHKTPLPIAEHSRSAHLLPEAPRLKSRPKNIDESAQQ